MTAVQSVIAPSPSVKGPNTSYTPDTSVRECGKDSSYRVLWVDLAVTHTQAQL